MTTPEFEALLKKAEQGSAEAQVAVAIAYRDGTDVDADPAAAFAWMQKAADQYNPRGMNGLGVCYFRGVGVEANDTLALKYFKKSAKSGYGPAWLNAYHRLLDDESPVYDEVAAAEWLERGVEAKVPEMLYQKAQDLLAKAGDDTDEEEAETPNYEEDALELLRQAAEQKYPPALRGIGEAYFHGVGVEQDLEEAEQWFVGAAELGDIEAMWTLIENYLPDGQFGYKADEVRRWSEEYLANVPDIEVGRFNLGLVWLMSGFDKETGLKYVQEAADNNVPEALSALGSAYLDGDVLPQDVEKGYQYLQKGAEAGFPYAQYRVGLAMHSGDLPMEQQKALDYLNNAFVAGFTEAALPLAEISVAAGWHADAALYYWQLYLHPPFPNLPEVELVNIEIIPSDGEGRDQQKDVVEVKTPEADDVDEKDDHDPVAEWAEGYRAKAREQYQLAKAQGEESELLDLLSKFLEE